MFSSEYIQGVIDFCNWITDDWGRYEDLGREEQLKMFFEDKENELCTRLKTPEQVR